MKYEYLLVNKNTKCYLRYIQDIDFKHYVCDPNDATVFTLTKAKKEVQKFKHPENWTIVRRKKTGLLRNITEKNKRKKVVRNRKRKGK